MHNNTSHSTSKRVWMITGTSQGLGQELVRAALNRGDSVIATSRHPRKVAASFPDAAQRLFVVSMNLNDSKQIEETVEGGVEWFGRIDVLVNNAGYGILGAAEEASDEEIARVHETNVKN